jgi:hypothetical protein
MGIYTSNRYFSEAYDYASEIPANKAYDAAFGCAHILADCQTNDMALFESTIYSDFAEVRAVQEGYGYVNENAFTNVIKKIVETFQKILAKIKGIFASFLTKMTSAFKNGKSLVEKYAKQIEKCPSWKGFKVKGIRVPKNENIVGEIDKIFVTQHNAGTDKVNYNINLGKSPMIDLGISGCNDANSTNNMDNADLKLAIAKLYVTNLSELKNIDTDVLDSLFKEETTFSEEDYKIDALYFSKPWIKSVLIDGKDIEKSIKKYNDQVEKNINQIIANLKKDEDALKDFEANTKNGDKMMANNFKPHNYDGVTNGNVNKFTDKDIFDKNDKSLIVSDAEAAKTGNARNYADTKDVQDAIHALQKVATCHQEVLTRLTSCYMSTFKFALAQSRKIWVSAAAWSSSVHKESVEYSQAVGESAAEQFYTNMEAIY